MSKHHRRVFLDPVEDAAVDARHGEHAGAAARIEQLDQLESPCKPFPVARGLEANQLCQRVRRRRRQVAFAAQATEILGGQVHPSVPEVLRHVPEDVRELERHAEVVGER